MDSFISRLLKATLLGAVVFFCAAKLGLPGQVPITVALAVGFLGAMAIADTIVYSIVASVVLFVPLSVLIVDDNGTFYGFLVQQIAELQLYPKVGMK